MFRSLDPEKIIATLEVLSRRVAERFPATGLARVSSELTDVARQTSSTIATIVRPYIAMRILVGLVLMLGAAAIAMLVYGAFHLETSTELTNVMQGVDSAMSILVLFGGGALYLSTFEARWRRDRALEALHELRSIIHVIDMHQLTKDPSALGTPRTSSSPDRSMTAHELLRYLSYCSEMLSLASKVAALYADKLRDPVIIDAVGDIERLTSNLSLKVWQKIELVQERMPARPVAPAPQPKAAS